MRIFSCTGRGLSTVVTSAILLCAVAIMGSFLVSWSNSVLVSHKMSMESTYAAKMNKLNELLIIENVWFGQTPSKFVNITVNNVGTVWLNVTKIQIVNSTYSKTFLFTHAQIKPGKSNSTNLSYGWTSGTPVDVIITTARDSVYREKAVP